MFLPRQKAAPIIGGTRLLPVGRGLAAQRIPGCSDGIPYFQYKHSAFLRPQAWNAKSGAKPGEPVTVISPLRRANQTRGRKRQPLPEPKARESTGAEAVSVF